MFTFNFATELSGSITRLPDGSSYLIAGNGISIVSQSNGSVLIALSGSLLSGPANLNTSGSFLSFYDAPPVAQHARVGQVDGLGGPRDTTPLSSNCHNNFVDLYNKVNDVVSKLNGIEAVISEAAGGIGVTE